MAEEAKGKGIFYGWYVVGACMLCISTGPGPFAFAATGLFILPFGEEFGWSRSDISLCLSLMVAATAITMPICGRWVDRVGSRKILIPSLVIMAMLLASTSLITELWHFALVMFLIGTLAVGTNSVPYMPVLSAWFFKRRGLAIGISIAGIGLGYFYMPLVVQALIDSSGWRTAYYALGGIVLFMAVPLAILLIKETPGEMGLMPDGEQSGEPPRATRKDVGLTGSEIFRHREFWLLSGIFVVLSFVLNGMLTHIVPMLSDRGMTPGAAAAVAATEGLTVFLSRICIGYLIDRFFAPRIAMVFFFLSALGIGVFAMGAVDTWAFVGAILIGLSLGAEVDLLAYLAGRYFGLRSFGMVYGLLFSAILLGTALGPWVFGKAFEVTGSYVSILTICVGINLLAVALTGFLGKYPDWEKVTETPAV